MKEGMWGLLGGILLLVGVTEVNVFLMILGMVVIIGLFITWWRGHRNKQAEEKERLTLTENLNAYLERYRKWELDKHIMVIRNQPLKDYRDAEIYYDRELCGTLGDLMTLPMFQKSADIFLEQMKKLGIVDENQNGIDDRLEKEQSAGMFAEALKRYIPLFEHIEIAAGLKEAVELLEQIALLEEKYPQIQTRLRKLYQHYLPLLLNILEQYQVLKDKNASPEEITQMETRLEKTVLLVNEALRTLMADFVSEDLLNMSSDITVLETVLKRDGLVKDGTLGGQKNGSF